MESQKLKQSITRILKKNIKKFTYEKFEAIITKLAVSSDIANFLEEIYVSKELKVKAEDIMDILQSFSEDPQLLKLFGNEIVIFWLEFEIIEFCELRQRLSPRELDAFPKKQQEQIQFLKDVVKKYKNPYIQDDQKELFQNISKKSIYKILCNYVKSAESGLKSSLKKSKIVDISRIKEDDYKILSLKFLKKILQTIPVPSGSNVQIETHQKLKNMFDEIILKKDEVQMPMLQSIFKEVIKNLLHLEVSNVGCKIIEKQIQNLKESFRSFKLFFNLQKMIIQCDLGKHEVTIVIDQVHKILSEYRSVWYWPSIVDDTLIMFLRNRCLGDKQKMSQLIETLNNSPPNFTSKMYHFKMRQFLSQAAFRISDESQKGEFVKWLYREGLNQNIDFEKQLPNNSCYAEIFEGLNLPMSMLQKCKPAIQVNPYQFFIYDIDQKQKIPIFLVKEDQANLVQKILNDYTYQAEKFNTCVEYNFECNINKYMMFAKYKKIDLKYQKEYKQISGFLIFCNLSQYRKKLKDFTWSIIDLTGKPVELTEAEKSLISQNLIEAINKKTNKITHKIASLGSMIEINCRTLQISLYSSVSNSKIKQQFGYLLSIPSFKSKTDLNSQLKNKIDEIYLPPQGIQEIQKEKKVRKAMGIEKKQNSQEDLGEKYQNHSKTFKYLGLFSSQFDPIDGYMITEQNHVQASKERTIQYFNRWRKEDLYKLLAKYLLLPKEVILSPEGLPKFLVLKRVQTQLKKQAELIQQKTQVKMDYIYNHVKQQLTIKNIKVQRKAHELFQQFFKYITHRYDEQQKIRSFHLKLNGEQQKYLKDKQNLEDIKVIRQPQGNIVIQSTKAEIQKLRKQMQALDEVHEFAYLNIRAFEIMKEQQKPFLEEIKLKELQKFQNAFKVAYQMKYHPSFQNKFKYYCQKEQNLPGQTQQRRIKKQASFIQLYRQKFALDPQIIVTKMNDDILLQYNSKKQKQVAKLLEQIQKEKQRQINQILRKQGNVYKLQNLEQIFIFALKNRIQTCLKQIPSFGFNAVLNVQYNNQKDEYIFRPVNTTKQQQKEIQKLMKLFMQRMQQFKKMKQNMYDTNQCFNNTLNKIPNNEVYKAKTKKMINQLKKKLETELTQIINKITAQGYKGLVRQFQEYLRKNKYQNQFTSESIQKSRKQLKKEIEEINIFEKYLNEKIEEAQKNSIVKKPALKDSINQEMKETTKGLEQKFKNGKIFPSQIKRFFKSFNILTTIFYGQQLPITAHLQQFKKKLIQNDIVMVKVGTGSGKSTVIPPYLVGSGYKKVVVTQPRRLPCSQIYQRITEVFGEGVAGYEVADSKRDTSNSLIYMTDGLLKMKANYDQTVFDNIDVLVIDQIHQRSANIDLLLLLLTKYFDRNSENTNKKLKLVLCSATIDEKIENLFKKGKLKTASFFVKTQKHKVTQHPIKEGTIINKILELSKNMKANEQMLVFIPGEAQVMAIVQILNKKFNKLAHPLTARCSQRSQEDILKHGQIFISTSIAQTSLTFKNLKYVIDSRLSRWRKFNPELQLMETQESYSSKSSIQQRKGRLGRTCPGQYYYFQYHDNDFSNIREHNVTQLQRVDLTNFIFQLLLSKKQTFNDVQALLSLLNHKKFEFNNKMNYSRQILQNSGILKKDGTLTNTAFRMIKYGNLGNPLFNMALDNAASKNFLVNMIYIISFQMYGLIVSEGMIDYCKKLYKGGDIKVVHDFLIEVGNKIDLITINPLQIGHQLKNQCKSLIQKPWFNILIKIMMKAKDLLKTSSTNLVASAKQWPEILKILALTYKNKVFFNQSLLGGNQSLYQKFKKDLIINYESEKQSADEINISYKVNNRSILNQRGSLPDVIISLNCEINAMNECVLSICQEIKEVDESFRLLYRLEGKECQEKNFVDTKPLKEQQIFNQITSEVKNKKGRVKVDLRFPQLQIEGSFVDIAQIVEKIIDSKRKNKELKIDLTKYLEDAIKVRARRAQGNKLAAVIDVEHSRRLFQRLDFVDYQRLFSAIKYEMKNKYDIDIQWDVNEKSLKIENAKNIHLNKILTKVSNFFTWFSDCQIISKEEYKIKPVYIGDSHAYSKEMKNKIFKVMDRVNQIVDSKLQHYVLKGWVNGKGPETKYPRTARMIAVCWVLVNLFNCTIKGGFVRDWVVNADEWLDLTVQERLNLLQPNARNKHRQVVNDKVTPSDIDAELPQSSDFDPIRFKKQMKKLGINIQIEDDGWRKHIIFDDKTESGGFTADLIQPYTALTHYTYDFDVNVMYLKKDHINSIGMKVPLEYEDNINKTSKKVLIYQLIELCMNKKMTALKNDIPDYRYKKFEERKWTINRKSLVQPICYKSQFTQSFACPIQSLKSISPEFYQMVINDHLTVVKIEQLSNKGWDDAFEAAQNWIINELQKQEKKSNPGKYNLKKINSNNRVLFHGTRTEQGARGIKEAGFDARYFNKTGYYGKGAYFADDPKKSHAYTSLPLRYMFLVNIALGKQEVLKAADNNKSGPKAGYHSILGQAGSHNEYIVDRWGQAKPLFLITYK